MSKIFRSIGLILLFVVLGVGGWVGYTLLNTPTTVKLEITYAQMPPDDQPLTKWLSSQQQVTQVAVARSGQTLNVTYKMPRESKTPATTDVVAACDRFGYQGRGGYTMHTRWP